MNAFAQTFAIAGVEVSVSASIGWLMARAGVSPDNPPVLRRLRHLPCNGGPGDRSVPACG